MQTEEKKEAILSKVDFGSGTVKDYKTYRISQISERDYPDGIRYDRIPEGFHVEYQGGLAVDISWWENNRNTHYCSIEKDDTTIVIYHHSLFDEKFFRLIQHCVGEVENGKYRNKKSIREMVTEIVERRGLTSYMNNTKWQEFRVAMEDEMPFPPPYAIKTLFEEGKGEYFDFSKDAMHPDCYDAEEFVGYNYKIIEWVKVRPRYYEYIGGRLAGKKIMHDAEPEFIEILNKYSIPYEANNGMYIIYGYK